MIAKVAIFCAIITALAGGCTENQQARWLGGKIEVELPCGKKFLNATWKDQNLWYIVRPMRADEEPEVHTFQEDSNLGVLEGLITFRECKK